MGDDFRSWGKVSISHIRRRASIRAAEAGCSIAKTRIETELPAQDTVSYRVAPYAPVSVTIIGMSPWVKMLVLAAALLVMPLQGIAATLTVLLCPGEAQKHGMHANGGDDRGMYQDNNRDEGNTSGNSVDHPCHNTVSAPLVVTLLAAAPDFLVRAFAPDSLYDPFVPEQPQRPPRA